MSSSELLNANPTIHHVSTRRTALRSPANDIFALPADPAFAPDADAFATSDDDEAEAAEPIDEQEIFDLLASINDPEHPLTLAQLAVINLDDIHITDPKTKAGLRTIHVGLTPTIPHCSMATLIGLCVRVRLARCLPDRFRLDIKVKEGTHQSERAVNRQLGDKERVAAACENEQLMAVLSGMMEGCA